MYSIVKTEENSTSPVAADHGSPTHFGKATSSDCNEEDIQITKQLSDGKNLAAMTLSKNGSKANLPSPFGSAKSFDLQVANWRLGKLEVDANSASEEEFYDCLGK